MRCALTLTVVAVAACSSSGDDIELQLSDCDSGSDPVACIADVDSIDSEMVRVLDEANGPESVEMSSGACTRSTSNGGPWSVCVVPVDDTQVVVGRDSGDDLVVQAVVDGAAVEFPLDNGDGRVTVINGQANSFDVRTPDGSIAGSLSGVAVSAAGPAESGIGSRLEVVDSSELACAPAPSAPPTDYAIVLDSVALPAASDYPHALQTNRRRAEGGGAVYFAKTGLLWRSSVAIEIEVPAELRDRLAINWGGGQLPKTHVVRADCDLDAEWAGLPGGYWVTEPLCAEIIVRVDGKEQRAQIGLGTPCPGQGPPQGPSDP